MVTNRDSQDIWKYISDMTVAYQAQEKRLRKLEQIIKMADICKSCERFEENCCGLFKDNVCKNYRPKHAQKIKTLNQRDL